MLLLSTFSQFINLFDNKDTSILSSKNSSYEQNWKRRCFYRESYQSRFI